MLIHQEKIDTLQAFVYDDRKGMGAAAAEAAIDAMENLLQTQHVVNVLFAAAPSQAELLEGLRRSSRIPWERINAFHMDEYIGLEPDAPQRFGNFLHRALFGAVSLREVYYIDGSAEDVDAECRRYARLLEKLPIDIVLHGIGENGHIAFNDPAVADFNDPAKVKVVTLDEICRQQQVNDGCFATFEEVPTHAVTVTIPELIRPRHVICTVPGSQKAKAVKAALFGEISESTPASILRTINTKLFLDKDSGVCLLG